ncbi:MAG: epoxyqueuosine reductase QueH [Pseudothermotoga sp.]
MKILLHVCCAPDATTAVERLREENYEPVLFFYNPNIQPQEEYLKRLEATNRLAELWGMKLIIEASGENLWKEHVKGLEDLAEGSLRCLKCIEFRLRRTAEYARKNDFEIFSTTLTTSPKKNSQLILEIGTRIGRELQVQYLHRDFKKKNGFLRSVQLSKELQLYRQNYCGCIYSLRNSNREKGTSDENICRDK